MIETLSGKGLPVEFEITSDNISRVERELAELKFARPGTRVTGRGVNSQYRHFVKGYYDERSE